MVVKTQAREAMLFKILLVTVGFLIGLGTAHVTMMAKVETNCVKLEMMNQSIQKNTKTNTATLDLVKAVVQQNSVLINSVVNTRP